MRKLLALGLLLVLAGISLVILGSSFPGSLSTGGVVFLGPFPIVFGSGRYGGELALMSVVIGAVMLPTFLLWGWRVSQHVQKT
jgi:uncharacterized membrane protein